MANLATTRQDEVFITRGNESGAETRAIQRRAKEGELTRIAEGIYLREKDPEARKAVVRRNWFRILGALAPGAVVSYRSAYAGGLTRDGVVYLSHPTNFNRKITLPGVQAVLGQRSRDHSPATCHSVRASSTSHLVRAKF